jgi:hypothetical protein
MRRTANWEWSSCSPTSTRNCNFASTQSARHFPIARRTKQVGDRQKTIRIEFEYRSSNFARHGHDAKGCDWIVCWHHDWYDAPRHIEIVELKKFFGVPRKVWIQGAVKSEQHWLDEKDRCDWVLSPRVTEGDLLLMYRASPKCCITDVYRFIGNGKISQDSGERGTQKAPYFYGTVERVCPTLKSPLDLETMRKHPVLRTASFIRANMRGRGGLLVSEYWPHLYAMLYARNPKHRRTLAKYAPEKMFA